ncbi:hypothetical protein Vi05172_g7608 [Venturia inaequalis]|nr:hypothetical protein Vi05172_g7608 [Venturia inaequalis]
MAEKAESTKKWEERLEAKIAEISNWWISDGNNLGDFATYPAEQPMKSNAIDPIPERLCYMFQSEARGPNTPIPDDITEADCTPRAVAGWLQDNWTVDDITNNFTGDSFRPARKQNRKKGKHGRKSSKTKSDELRTVQNTISNNGQRWRWSNGPLSQKPGSPKPYLPEKYKVPLLRLSNAQHFFRVIGDIPVEDFNRGIFQMSPPYDHHQKTAGVPAIRYELPKPKEIHPVIRKTLLDRGRVLPTLSDFLHRHPAIWSHFYPSGNIPGEQRDEVEAFSWSQQIETYNAAKLRGENVTKPVKPKQKRVKNQADKAVIAVVPTTANTGFPGNTTNNNLHPLTPSWPSHNQQRSATAQPTFDNFTTQLATNLLPNHQPLGISNQRKPSIISYLHQHGGLINELASLGYDNTYGQVVRMVEAANGDKETAIRYLLLGLPGTQDMMQTMTEPQHFAPQLLRTGSASTNQLALGSSFDGQAPNSFRNNEAPNSFIDDFYDNHDSAYAHQNTIDFGPNSENEQRDSAILTSGISQTYNGVVNPNSYSAPHLQSHQQQNHTFELDPTPWPSELQFQSQPPMFTNEDNFEARTRDALLQNGYGTNTQTQRPSDSPFGSNLALMSDSSAANTDYLPPPPPQASPQTGQDVLTFNPREESRDSFPIVSHEDFDGSLKKGFDLDG